MANGILVGIDFSPISERAFAKALELARALSAPLELVHVSPPIPIESRDSGGESAYVSEAEAQLRGLAEVAALQGTTARCHVLYEAVVFGLLEAIGELDPQLVIVGSHGRSGIESALLGSVSESLARRSPTPVLIVPALERAKSAAAAAWACTRCGHMLGRHEDHRRCKRCGTAPASWTSAPLIAGPVDASDPAVGEAVACDLQSVQTQSSGGPFATSPGGISGREVNAELRVRY
jgi:universal stress protein A